MAVFQPRANLSNFRSGNTTADAINSLAQVFTNDLVNQEAAKKRELVDLQRQQLESNIASKAAEAEAAELAQQEIDSQFNTLVDLFTPTIEQQLPTGVEGPVLPGVSVEEKLSDPANIGALNKAQINLFKQGFKPTDIANLLRSASAQAGIRDEMLQRSFVGAGGKFGVNDAISLEGQEDIAERNLKNKLALQAAKPRSRGISFTSPDGSTIQIGGTGGSKVPIRTISDVGTAAALAGSQVALQNIGNKIFRTRPDGTRSVNRVNIGLSNVPGLGEPGNPTAVPFTVGTEIKRDYQEAVANKIFAQSGKTVSKNELERISAMFIPAFGDTDKAVEDKYDSLVNWTGDTVELLGIISRRDGGIRNDDNTVTDSSNVLSSPISDDDVLTPEEEAELLQLEQELLGGR